MTDVADFVVLMLALASLILLLYGAYLAMVCIMDEETVKRRLRTMGHARASKPFAEALLARPASVEARMALKKAA